MAFTGLLLGLATFIIIGAFHPLVVRLEYHWGTKPWIFFLIAGLLLIITSLFISRDWLSIFFGVLGFSCLFCVREIFLQNKRAKSGYAKQNPKRSY